MKLHESGAALAEGVAIEAHCQASLKTAKDPDGGPNLHIRAVSRGMKPLARRVQERGSTTTAFREPICQHSPTVSQSSL